MELPFVVHVLLWVLVVWLCGAMALGLAGASVLAVEEIKRRWKGKDEAEADEK